MSEIMLHGILNMPLPSDPKDCDIVTWVQFKSAAQDASTRIEELEAEVKSMAMDCLVAHGQASDAYQAQLLAEAKLQDQAHLIEQFFALMDITEQTDEGRYFKPNRIYSSRVMDAEKLDKVLAELKQTLKVEE